MDLTQRQLCLIFAHRGASREEAENTPCAFEKSMQQGADGIETDVQLSQEGIPVLWHDRFMDRLGLANKRIDEFDFEALTSLYLPVQFTRGQKDSRLMGLEEFIRHYLPQTRLLIEAKNREWDQASGRHILKMRRCVDLANQYSNPENRHRILISSFNLKSLRDTYEYSIEWPLVFNSESISNPSAIQRFFRDNNFISGLCLPIESLNQGIVDTLRDIRKSISTYTCNSDEEILKALHLKVDILISDDPKKAIELRN